VIGLSLDVVLPRIELSRYSLVFLIINDMKILNNPITPMPEKIGIARTWSKILCKLVDVCIDVDYENISKVIDAMAEYVSREIKRKSL